MIEVLVASTILIVIVMLLAMLFQQTSIAWRTGQIRAQGAMKLRTAIGAIQRDASAAIDAKNIPQALLYNNEQQSFKPGEIRFYTLTGKADTFFDTQDGDEKAVPLKRALCFISYTTDGVRTKYAYSSKSGWQMVEQTQVLKYLIHKSQDKNKDEVVLQKFQFRWPGTSSDGFPLYMWVEATLEQEGVLYDVGAESSGPDKEFGDNSDVKPGKDDIRTWAK